MGRQTSKISFELGSYKKGNLGFKAVLAICENGSVVYTDEVSLWNDKKRDEFITRMIEKVALDLTSSEETDFRRAIHARLMEIEKKIRSSVESKKSDNNSLDNSRQKEISEKEKDEALMFLQDPELLARVQDDLTVMGVVDEEHPKVLIYLIATSRKMHKGLAATIKASSSAGKNHVVGKVVELMPPEDVQEFTNLSAKALYYLGENGIKNKLVVCTEVAGRETAEYAVRALLSEPYITSSIPVRKHEGGPPQTENFRVNGPISYLDTTTSHWTHPENATRLFEIYLNETVEQTKSVLAQQAREAGPKRYEIQKEREQIKQRHQNAQRLLRPNIDVVIPYADLIAFPSEDIRARRDFQKLLNLISSIAFVSQYQREIKRTESGQEYVEAQLLDYELAYAIAKETFADTLDELDKRSRDVLDTVAKKMSEEEENDGLVTVQATFTRDNVSSWTRKKKNKLIPVFKELEAAEYFLDEQGDPIKHWLKDKRQYTVNWGALSRKPTLDALTTPEELERTWKARQGQPEKLGQNGKKKSLENQPPISLSLLSPLSPAEK